MDTYHLVGEAKGLAVRFPARPIYAIKRSRFIGTAWNAASSMYRRCSIYSGGETKGRGSKSSGSLRRQRTSTPGGHDLWRGRLITTRLARIRKQISQILIRLSRLIAARLRRRCRESVIYRKRRDATSSLSSDERSRLPLRRHKRHELSSTEEEKECSGLYEKESCVWLNGRESDLLSFHEWWLIFAIETEIHHHREIDSNQQIRNRRRSAVVFSVMFDDSF